MPDITKIKIGNEREHSYKDFPANREFKKRAEDDNPGGGGWPADLPKPSVGGYGYTESGEQTVITWDGDIEGRESFESEGAVLYKVANVPQYFDKDSVSKITETTGETDFAVLDMSEMAGVIAFSYNNSKMLLMVVVDYEKANAVFHDASLTTNGVFFAVNGDIYTSSLTYGTPDTIHKIDEKYLPGTVVEFVLDETMSAVESASKTIVEVRNAMLTGPVVGVVKASRDGQEIVNPVGCATTDKRGNPAFSCYYDVDNSSWVETVGVEDHEWAFKVGFYHDV